MKPGRVRAFETGRYETVIGLEVHAQLRTQSKLFCGCSTRYGASPNSQVCPVCLGHPGALPVVNGHAIDLAIRLGLALGCDIAPRSVWARKSYFYPDLPKGYQITQYDAPICRRGEVPLDPDGGEAEQAPARSIPLIRIHLEEDAGKSKHPEREGEEDTRIDFNRAGIPLVEIVSAPVLRCPREAGRFLEALRRLLAYIEVCDGNMAEGNLRCDANLSLRRHGSEVPGTRTEIKNLNSIRNLERALLHEATRQAALLDRGEEIPQETRLFEESSGRTRRMRGKEEAEDYRYFPEPDLPFLLLDSERIEGERRRLPELPSVRRARFHTEYGLSQETCGVLTRSRSLSDYYEAVVGAGPDRSAAFAALAAHWVRGDLLGRLHALGKAIEDPAEVLPPAAFAELLRALGAGRISPPLARAVLEEMIETGESVEVVSARRGWRLVSDESQVREWVDGVLREHPAEVALYRAGRSPLLNFFIGQAMKRSRGQADPGTLRRLLERELED